MVAIRLIVMLALAGAVCGCSAAGRRPDPVAQLAESGLPVEEQNQILSNVFAHLVTALHGDDLPAYLRLGEMADPPPAVLAAVRARGLRVEAHSAQPRVDTSGDGIPGSDVFIYGFQRPERDRVVVDAGIMAGILAGDGHQFMLVKTGDEWRIEKRERTWRS